MSDDWFGRYGPVVLLVLAVVLSFGLMMKDGYVPGAYDPYVLRNVYEGTIPGYHVRIITANRASGDVRNTVRIQRLADREAGRPDWVNVAVAHDEEGELLSTDEWENVYWFGEEFGDLSAERFRRTVPNPEELFTLAVETVYDPDHLVMDLETFLAELKEEEAGSSGS